MNNTQQWNEWLHATLDAMLIVDVDTLMIVDANANAENLLGMTCARLQQQRITHFFPTPEDELFWQEVQRGNDETLQSETLLNGGDGCHATVLRKARPIQLDEQRHYLVALQDRSERKQIEQRLEAIIDELRATLESSVDGILVLDNEGSIRGFNKRFAELFKIPKALLTRRNDQAVLSWLQQLISHGGSQLLPWMPIDDQQIIATHDQVELHDGRVLEQISTPQFARGKSIGRYFSYRDITEKLANDHALALASQVFTAAPQAICVLTPAFDFDTSNPHCQRLLGFREGQEKLNLAAFMETEVTQSRLREWRDSLQQQNSWQGEVALQDRNGRRFPASLSLVRMPETAHHAERYVCFIQDLTPSKEAQRRIEELAYRDVLTGLPNRASLHERLGFMIEQAKRQHTPFALLFLDVDRFKIVNDALGHATGDLLLRAVSKRLQGCLRQVDMIARLGGDEFIVLLHETHERGAETFARRVLEAMQETFVINDMPFSLSISIGIALYPEDGGDNEELIRNADSAMYAVKERGRSDYRFYQPQMNVGLLSRMKLDQAMRAALEQQQFELHYQPQLCLQTQTITGVEALLRWPHPEHGFISPAQFIPIAEETGTIINLGRWVLRQACQQASLWHRDGKNLTVSVNVSALQFQQTGFVDSVHQALQEFALPPSMLELELTESVLINDVEDTQEKLSALKMLGVAISIDDFGTGYSSFGYLKRLPVSKLKIDRSFIAQVPDNENDSAIVTAMISMAKILGLQVVAEGVETSEQRHFLQLLRCDFLQGFLFSPAQKVEVIDALLRDSNSL
ncbi:bifunctional diguanylate cyclase/phosphodiesterase [Permianibacter aggregans]|uniref:cyclic-guanylate-specific phosphodiesterase n=1 Tax=Permianibacter aggregans TaxID=1510150 RepID=A0A4R6UGX0_9GAMM|nr:bifunctional diguanylate cyclase/phosphodiesterase [Permianibacter aggregans]QGX39272.1 bifunctional diguanylate cyclase/phosphodiesterase [Permianibacter aggregans]TDQ46081.1 diguanylate cyclase/phosphodiesterase with PAS/PAC sensor(s) [Permianibacter aggregans]